MSKNQFDADLIVFLATHRGNKIKMGNYELARKLRSEFLTLERIRQLLGTFDDDDLNLQRAADDIIDEEKRLDQIAQDAADAEPSDFSQHNTHRCL